jgi:RNA polymerase sigma-70 factor (ECF subfamily)
MASATLRPPSRADIVSEQAQKPTGVPQKSHPSQPALSGHGPFVTTNWSAVRLAGDGDATGSGEALEALCRAYWHPVYAYVRRRGYPPEDARDLTQGLFLDLLSRDAIAKADQGRGRFRTFLLAALGNFLSKETEKSLAAKRGSGQTLLSLDAESGEEFFQLESGESFEPEKLFDRRWAHQMTGIALDRLRAETDSGAEGRFDALRKYLLSEPEPGDYEARAAELGLSVNGIKTAVRRLRIRFGAILREEVARTVADADQVDDELSHLLGVLASP